MPKEGIFAKVITPGTLRAGDRLEYIQKVIKTGVITLSTRASEGIYEDLSGPEIISALDLFSKEKGFAISTDYRLIPDSRELLGISIKEMINSGVDIIITTGGTGIGPQDITPEELILLLKRRFRGLWNISVKNTARASLMRF
jgi:molybdenum cofactor synthesis domain-containing protein